MRLTGLLECCSSVSDMICHVEAHFLMLWKNAHRLTGPTVSPTNPSAVPDGWMAQSAGMCVSCYIKAIFNTHLDESSCTEKTSHSQNEWKTCKVRVSWFPCTMGSFCAIPLGQKGWFWLVCFSLTWNDFPSLVARNSIWSGFFFYLTHYLDTGALHLSFLFSFL